MNTQIRNSNFEKRNYIKLIIGKLRLRAMCSRFHSNSKYCYSSESVKTLTEESRMIASSSCVERSGAANQWIG